MGVPSGSKANRYDVPTWGPLVGLARPALSVTHGVTGVGFAVLRSEAGGVRPRNAPTMQAPAAQRHAARECARQACTGSTAGQTDRCST